MAQIGDAPGLEAEQHDIRSGVVLEKLASALLGAGVLLGTWTAHAAPVREVAVAPVVVDGELGDDARRKLEADTVRGIRREGVLVVAPQTVVERVPAAADCGDDDCIVDVGRDLDVSHVVTTRVEVDGRDYALTVRLFEVATGHEVQRESATCEICGLGEVTDQLLVLSSHASKAIPEAKATVSTVEIDSDPEGAAVFVDNVPVGQTPVVVHLEPGPHTLKMEKHGHQPHADSFDVEDGVNRRLAYVLPGVVTAPIRVESPPPSNANGEDDGRRRFLVGGWTLIGLGAGSVVGGAALIELDGEPVRRACFGDAVDETGLCRWRHTTRTGGIGMLSAGIVSVGAGVALLVIGHRRSKRAASGDTARRVRVSPSARGLGVRF